MTQVDEEMTKKKDTEAPQINALMYLFFTLFTYFSSNVLPQNNLNRLWHAHDLTKGSSLSINAFPALVHSSARWRYFVTYVDGEFVLHFVYLKSNTS